MKNNKKEKALLARREQILAQIRDLEQISAAVMHRALDRLYDELDKVNADLEKINA